MIKTIPTVRASPLLLSIQIIVLRNYCVILFWPSGQCTLFTVFKYDFSTYFNRETKRDLTSRAILSCPLSLRFNTRVWEYLSTPSHNSISGFSSLNQINTGMLQVHAHN